MKVFSEILRRLIFWQIDSIKGGHVQNAYSDIRFILNNYNDPLSLQKRKKYLQELLQHARKTTAFYSNTESDELKDFPIINKNTIRESSGSFETNDSSFKTAKTAVTSGSTGTPFTIKHDKRKTIRNTADTIFFSELAGFNVGQRLYYFKIWNSLNKKSRISQTAQNLIPYDVSKLDDTVLPSIIERLGNDNSNKGLLAYSSVYEEISRYMLINMPNRKIGNISSVIAMSESFDIPSKKSISNFFNTIAVSRYSNMENGIIAQQLKDGSDDYLINEASYVIELLDLNSDTPASPGSPGRIIVTDLFNYCMPMIRYDTGDIGVLGEKEIFGAKRKVLMSIEGRKMDQIYNTSGSLMSSYIITNNMWKYKEVKQYQFIQNTEKDYIFILNTDQPFLRDVELVSEFKGYLGENANIQINYVQEIPVLASGKRRKVINNYIKP